MALKVPYDPTPSVGPSNQAIPGRSLSVPAGAFGAESAQAGMAEARAWGNVGEEAWKRAVAIKEVQNQTEAREADAEYTLAASEIYIKHRDRLGKNAVEAFPQYKEDLKNVRQQIREKLSNEMAQKMYDGATLNTMTRTIFSGASHTATENKSWALGASTARVKTLGDQALTMPNDEGAFRESIVSVKSEVVNQGQLRGWDQAQVDQEISTQVSSLWAKRIQGTAKNNPASAKKMLDEALKTGELRGEQIAPVTNYVNTQLQTVGSRQVAERIQSGADPEFGRSGVSIERASKAMTIAEGTKGSYTIKGPLHPKYGYPLGKYQVMESNLQPWLKEAGMPAMTSEQFLNNGKAQEDLFKFKFGQYLTKFGNFDDAASAWHSGVPLKQAIAEKRHDRIPGVYKGMTTEQYVANARRALSEATPLAEKVERAKAIAQEEAPNDLVYQDMVEQRVIASQAQDDRIRRDAEQRVRTTVEAALIGGQDGNIPTTMEELRAKGPEVETAFSQMPPEDQRRVLGILKKNASGERVTWTEPRLREDQRLRGMAQSDPAEFLAVDVMSLDLPVSAKRGLMTQQIKMRGKAEGDPQVQRAMRILKPTLGPANLDTLKADNRERYFQFVGALQDALTDYQTENKKQPDEKALNVIAGRLMQEQSQPRFFGLWNSKVPTFEIPVPEKDAEIIKNTIKEQLGADPSEAQIQRAYTRMLYKRLYSSKPEAQQGPTVAAPESK